MPHIHKLYDFVVSIFIVRKRSVFLVYHKKYKEWLPIGGHIELDEDPEVSLYREIEEECGLSVKILQKAPKIAHPGVKPIPTPAYVDVHDINRTHKHVAFVYFGVAKKGEATLHEREHREFCWVNEKDLKSPQYNLTPSILFYCQEALRAARREKTLS